MTPQTEVALSDPALVHLAKRLTDDVTSCETYAFSASGRCQGRAAAVRLEDGFADVVCSEHAHRAAERSSAVIWVTS